MAREKGLPLYLDRDTLSMLTGNVGEQEAAQPALERAVAEAVNQPESSFGLTVEEAQLLCTSSVPMTEEEMAAWDDLRERLSAELAATGHTFRGQGLSPDCDFRDQHALCEGTAKTGAPCICPCHSATPKEPAHAN